MPPKSPPMEFELDMDRIRLGRSEGCDVVIKTPQVSSIHLELTREGDSFRLVDKDTTNGTRVNGKEVTEVVLQDGDEIMIGNSVAATFSILSEAKAAVAAVPAPRPASATALTALPRKPGVEVASPAAPVKPSSPTVVIKRSGGGKLPAARPPIRIAKPMPPAASKSRD